MSYRFLSVCSGLGGAELAVEGLDWQCAGVAEIEAFPAAVIARRYPHLRNFGDFTKIKAEEVGPVDVLIGGPPCQAFSLAGKGLSLADTRGVLILEFARLAHDLARLNRGLAVVFENVRGILVRDDNPFGCFLGLLVGHDRAFPKPQGASWPAQRR